MQEELLVRATQSIGDIVTVDNIIFIHERLALLRDSSSLQGKQIDYTQGNAGHQQDLKRLWGCIGFHEKAERWAKSLQRACAGIFYGRYIDEREAFNKWNTNATLLHPIEMYVDVCFPETIIRRGAVATERAIAARAQAKRKFQNEVQRKKLWVMMNRRYGVALFFLLSTSLQDEQ
jgi:hypothetical protein